MAATHGFRPGMRVQVCFDRVTSFNGHFGQVVSIPAGGMEMGSAVTDVLVLMEDGLEVGRRVFFAAEELRLVRPMVATDMIYMDALVKAVDHLRNKENEAALKEGLGEVCSRLVGIFTYHNGWSLEMRALFDYGQLGGRMGKSARILWVNDTLYLLEWV